MGTFFNNVTDDVSEQRNGKNVKKTFLIPRNQYQEKKGENRDWRFIVSFQFCTSNRLQTWKFFEYNFAEFWSNGREWRSADYRSQNEVSLSQFGVFINWVFVAEPRLKKEAWFCHKTQLVNANYDLGRRGAKQCRRKMLRVLITDCHKCLLGFKARIH